MKKLFTLLFAALARVGAMSAQGVYCLDLTAPTNPESFTFNDNGVWTETYNDVDYTFIECTPFAFSHLIGGEGASWGGYYWDGFTVSRSAAKSGWEANRAGGGMKLDGDNAVVDAASPYLVGYWAEFMESPDHHTTQMIFNDGNAYEAVGVYVNMNAQSYTDVTAGSGAARTFNHEGDSFVLIAHGVSPEGTESTASIELAGFHDGTFTALTDWTYWDLSSLGLVESIYFTMTSTDVGDWGTNTSTYFALSHMTVAEPENTGVSEISNADITGVKYYNLAGVASDAPFDGVNIVVTSRADGTQSTTKICR